MGPFVMDNSDPMQGFGDSGFGDLGIDPNSILPGDSGGPTSPIWGMLATLIGRIPLPGGRVPLQLPAGAGGGVISTIPAVIRGAGGAIAGLSRRAKVIAALTAAGIGAVGIAEMEKLFSVDKDGNLIKRRKRRRGITGAQLHAFTRVSGILDKWCVRATHHRHVRKTPKKRSR